jgi:hypothetical protein
MDRWVTETLVRERIEQRHTEADRERFAKAIRTKEPADVAPLRPRRALPRLGELASSALRRLTSDADLDPS